MARQDRPGLRRALHPGEAGGLVRLFVGSRDRLAPWALRRAGAVVEGRAAGSGVVVIHTGDCVEVMAAMEPASVDAIVTDPPYGLEFMGKEWDSLGAGNRMAPRLTMQAAEPEAGNPWASERTGYGTPKRNPRCRTCGKQKFNHPKSRCVCVDPQWDVEGWHHNYRVQEWHEQWAREAYRIAKPGAYLLAFGGTRTYHRMTCAIEDAGWIIRDCLVWAYASGFPKSRALLKPAWEPIVMARKPGPLRELAIDACWIPSNGESSGWSEAPGRTSRGGLLNITDEMREAKPDNPAGRWPANLILTDPIFDGDTPGVVGGGETTTGDIRPYEHHNTSSIYGGGEGWRTASGRITSSHTGDSGTYSRFFLIPKADRAEREPVLPPNGHDRAKRFTTHPTVKPLDLMRHLVRLVTPTGGTVLDPFLGSGTTALAAEMEGFAWVGIEKEPEYVAIAEARLNGTQRGLGLPA